MKKLAWLIFTVGLISNTTWAAVKGRTPDVVGCGGWPPARITGTDREGIIKAGGGAVKTCTILFSAPAEHVPACVFITNDPNQKNDVEKVSKKELILNFKPALVKGQIYYKCKCFVPGECD